MISWTEACQAPLSIEVLRLEYWNGLPFLTLGDLVAQTVKGLPAMWETWVQSLDWEDPLEKEMATHSSILAGKSVGRRSLPGYSPWGCRVGHN